MTLARTSAVSAAGREFWGPTLELSMREVFMLMLASPLELLPEPPEEDGLDITAMVGLAGQVCGILSLRCGAKAAGRMASRMLGVDPSRAGPEMWDAVGEICNMVAGSFKNKISGLGDGCLLSVPTVITGGNYSVHSRVSDNVQTWLSFEGEPLIVSLEVH
jgi:chemotaxis protein CheX